MVHKKNTKTIKDLLSKGDRLCYLTQGSSAFSKINQAVTSALPSMLAEHCTTRSFQQGILTLVTTNNATATQLRYNTPALKLKLKKLPLLSGLEHIAIKVVASPTQPKQRLKKPGKVSCNNRKLLRETADSLSADDLSETLKRLADTLDNHANK